MGAIMHSFEVSTASLNAKPLDRLNSRNSLLGELLHANIEPPMYVGIARTVYFDHQPLDVLESSKRKRNT